MPTRYNNLDYLRVGATILVVLIHITLSVVGQFDTVSRWQWVITAIMDVLTLTAVPLFVMISGALLLQPNDESVVDFYTKRIRRILPAAIFYITIYLWWSVASGYESSIKSYLIKTVIYGNPYTHLYFLFIIFGLYLLTPWLRKMLVSLSARDTFYLVITLLGLTSIWQMSVVWMTQSFLMSHLTSTSLFVPYLGYYLAGYYFFTQKTESLRKRWLIAGILAISTLIVSLEYMLLNQFGASARGLITRDYQFPLVVLLSLAVFVFFTRLPSLPKSRLVSTISRASFGIFLIHQLVLDILKRLFYIETNNLLPHVVIILLVFTVSISFLITSVFSKIPLLGIMSGMEKSSRKTKS